MTYALMAWRFLKGLPWWVYVALAIIAAIALAYRAGYNTRDERADREEAELFADIAKKSAEARAAQIAVNRAAEERYADLAKDADHDHETTRIVVRDATDRHIIANGVQDGQCVPSGTSAPASGDSPAVPESVPAHVILDTADVRACGDLYAYSLAAHLWAVGLAEEE